MAFASSASPHPLVAVAVLAIAVGAQPAAANHGSDPVEAPVPRAQCGPGSDPESGRQGRVPKAEVDSGRATRGYTCNTRLLGRSGPQNYQGGAGGYKVFRYVDKQGQECAYYDTTLLYPANVSAGQVPGVWVLDMSRSHGPDPQPPVRTAELVTQAMLSPHESLVLNRTRGLLAAAYGTPVTAPGQVDIYDLADDCLHPKLRSSLPVGTLGHEGAMAPDGNTYYIASLDAHTLTAIDIANPDVPVPIFATTAYRSHGLSISDDGRRAYIAERTGLIILDVSQVQARVPNAQAPEISRLSWPTMTTPQATIPVTINGHSYLIEFDEFASDKDGDAEGVEETVGAARIIDIANETQPRVVSNIKLEVNMAENRKDPSQLADYGNGPQDTTGFQGYAAHYCEVPQRLEPTILACSFILSGMRVFDIRDPFHPTEIAYFNGPILPTNASPTYGPASYAMSAPAFDPLHQEIWYADGNSGFYSVQITNDAWPLPEPGGALALASGALLLAALRAGARDRRASSSPPSASARAAS